VNTLSPSGTTTCTTAVVSDSRIDLVTPRVGLCVTVGVEGPPSRPGSPSHRPAQCTHDTRSGHHLRWLVRPGVDQVRRVRRPASLGSPTTRSGSGATADVADRGCRGAGCSSARRSRSRRLGGAEPVQQERQAARLNAHQKSSRP